MERRGRPSTGRSKLPLSATIERDIADWLDTKDNKTDVVNFCLRKQMISEQTGNLQFLRIQLAQLKLDRDRLQLEIERTGGMCSHIALLIQKIENTKKEEDEKMKNLVDVNESEKEESQGTGASNQL